MLREVTNWAGECELRYGRPRYPQSQSLVEQGNNSVTKILGKMKMQSESPHAFKWADELSKCMYNMNTDYHSCLKDTAFNVIFCRGPNIGTAKNLVNLNSQNEDKFFKKMDSYNRIIKYQIVDIVDSQSGFSFKFDSYGRILQKNRKYAKYDSGEDGDDENNLDAFQADLKCNSHCHSLGGRNLCKNCDKN